MRSEAPPRRERRRALRRSVGALLALVAVVITAAGIADGRHSRSVRQHPRAAAATIAAPRTAAATGGAAPMIPVGRAPALRSHARHVRGRRPAVVVEPDSVAVAAGRVAGFTAAASGAPAPRLQWQRSNNGGRRWTSIPGAHRVTYTFTAKLSETGTEYRALFTNALGRAATRAVRLTVRGRSGTSGGSGGSTGSGTTGGSGGASGAYGSIPSSPPQITAEPADQSVQSGQTANFATGASGTVASVQWQVSTDAGADWSNVPYATGMSYLVVAATYEDGYQYRAVLSNSAGSTTTRAATLTVTLAPGDAAPQVTTQPVSDTIASGGYATFTAAASGIPTPTVQWQVSSNAGQTWGAITGATSTSYTFMPTDAQSGYEYRAAFSNAAGSATTTAATLTVAAGSGNWAGYIALGGQFSALTGSWKVPPVTCPAGATAYSSQWIGIDGALDDTVEQDGTESDCQNGVPYYGAWYEMYGDSAVNNGWEVGLSPSSYPVAAGDAMTASVSLSGSTWTLAINDTTEGWQVSTNIASPSPALQQSSAEWILERPEVNGALSALSDFGNAAFTSATATDSAASGPISDFSYQASEMVDSDWNALATPGPLAATGDGFSVGWNASS